MMVVKWLPSKAAFPLKMLQIHDAFNLVPKLAVFSRDYYFMNGSFGEHLRFYFHEPVSQLIVLSAATQRSHNAHTTIHDYFFMKCYFFINL